LGVALLLPFALLAEHLADDPAARAALAGRPQAAVQLTLALAFCTALFGWPLVRLARALAHTRSIVIDGRSVTVTERGLFAARTWSEPLAGYRGLAHSVRASLSGLRHELILVHKDPALSVLLAVANRISQAEVDRAASVLGLAEIPSREAYRLALIRGMLGPAEPQPRLAAART
jgi:hypothetical protein